MRGSQWAKAIWNIPLCIICFVCFFYISREIFAYFWFVRGVCFCHWRDPSARASTVNHGKRMKRTGPSTCLHFFLEKSTAFFRFEKGPTKEKKIFPIVDIDSSRRYLRRYNPTTTKEGQRMYTWLNNDLCNRENICKVHFTCNVHEAKKNLFIYICNLTGSMLLSNVRICIIQDASTFFFPIYVYNICRMWGLWLKFGIHFRMRPPSHQQHLLFTFYAFCFADGFAAAYFVITRMRVWSFISSIFLYILHYVCVCLLHIYIYSIEWKSQSARPQPSAPSSSRVYSIYIIECNKRESWPPVLSQRVATKLYRYKNSSRH